MWEDKKKYKEVGSSSLICSWLSIPKTANSDPESFYDKTMISLKAVIHT